MDIQSQLDFNQDLLSKLEHCLAEKRHLELLEECEMLGRCHQLQEQRAEAEAGDVVQQQENIARGLFVEMERSVHDVSRLEQDVAAAQHASRRSATTSEHARRCFAQLRVALLVEMAQVRARGGGGGGGGAAWGVGEYCGRRSGRRGIDTGGVGG